MEKDNFYNLVAQEQHLQGLVLNINQISEEIKEVKANLDQYNKEFGTNYNIGLLDKMLEQTSKFNNHFNSDLVVFDKELSQEYYKKFQEILANL